MMVETNSIPTGPKSHWFFEDDDAVGQILTRDRPDIVAQILALPDIKIPITIILDLVVRDKSKVAYFAMAQANDFHNVNLDDLMKNSVYLVVDLKENGIPQEDVAQVFTQTLCLMFKVKNKIPFDEPIDEEREELLHFTTSEFIRTVDQIWTSAIARNN